MNRCSTSCAGTKTMKSDEPILLQVDSDVVQAGSRLVQAGSSVVQGEPKRSRPPEWWEFEAATPVNQSWKGLRIAGFVLFAGGAVVVMYEAQPPPVQALALLGCVLYVLILDPFVAVGSILARASRVILASAVCLIGTAVIMPVPGLIAASFLWTLAAVAAVRKFNHRYLMQDTFASARNIPDALRTAPESKAGLAWRHSGAKLANAVAAEIGATCRNHSEVKARELAFYIGYQMADNKSTELSRKCDRLRLENTMLKDAETERNDLLQRINEEEAEHRKRLERANAERQQLLKRIRELEATNAELVRAVPEEVQVDDVDSKLEYAFLVLHLTDREAAEFAGTNKTRATRYRKEHNIEPRGGGP